MNASLEILKFGFPEKTTKIWKDLPLCMFWRFQVSSKKFGGIFSNFVPSDNIWTLLKVCYAKQLKPKINISELKNP